MTTHATMQRFAIDGQRPPLVAINFLPVRMLMLCAVAIAVVVVVVVSTVLSNGVSTTHTHTHTHKLITAYHCAIMQLCELASHGDNS